MQARCRTSPSTAKTPRRPLVWLLEYDFCPWANRWLYWMKRPIASLALAGLAALACAIFVKPLALVACGATLVVVLLGYVWPSVAVRGLDCSIRFTQTRVSENEPATARVRIVNRWPWPVWGMSLEGGFDGGNEGGNPRAASVALARVAGWATTEFEWSFIPRCRGEYPSQPPRLVTGFPFGLRHASRPVTVEQPLLVWPQIVPLETLLDAAETRPSDDSYSDHRVGDSGDMTGTRPFRDGDSLRRVHWAQTARHGRMIVCERQAPAQSAIRVVFDSAQHLHRGSGGNSTLEWSIRLAASICAAYHRENAQVECCFGHEVIPIAHGPRGLQRFLDFLARWQPTVCEHDQRHCHRIHPSSCGLFQLTITTDIGLQHRTEHRHVHGDQRLVVLNTAAFGGPLQVCGQTHAPLSRHAIVLDRPDGLAAEFRRKWRHICHAG